ncbi:MAG: hypothetical protein JOZ49_11870 [Mycolicibacterium sp.]|nr:hypothetical protein [Mycolicibacterium sp.]
MAAKPEVGAAGAFGADGVTSRGEPLDECLASCGDTRVAVGNGSRRIG